MISMQAETIAKLTTRYKVSPCWMLKLTLTSGDKWFSTVHVNNSAITWRNKIVSISNISRTSSAIGVAALGEVTISVDDTDGSLRDIVKKNTMYKAPATVYLTFVNEDGSQLQTSGGANIFEPMFTGALKVPLQWSEDSRIIELTVEASLNNDKTISKPNTVTFGSHESLSNQGEWPVAIGTALWKSDIFLERMQIYLLTADHSYTGFPAQLYTDPNVSGAPSGTVGVCGVFTDGGSVERWGYWVFNKDLPSAGPKLLSGPVPFTMREGAALYLTNVNTSNKSFWFKTLLNRYTGQYFSATSGAGNYNFSWYLHFERDDKHLLITTGGGPSGLTANTVEGYKIGTADLPGATNQYAGVRGNFDPLTQESVNALIKYQSFRDMVFQTSHSIRIRQVLREFIETFSGHACGTSLTTSTFDSIYPTNQTDFVGIMTETGADVFKIASQFCLELGIYLYQNAAGQMEILPAKASTSVYTITESYILAGTIAISETQQDAVFTVFKLNSVAESIFNGDKNPDGVAGFMPDALTYTYSNNVSTYGSIEYPPINAVACASIRDINKNGLKHLGYKLSNRWLILELTLIRVGVRLEVFDVVQIDLPNELPLASGVLRGRVISASTDTETLHTKLKIELAIKAGSANASGQYTEDAAYWNGPA